MRTICLCLCGLALSAVMYGCSRHETSLLQAEKVRSLVTPEAEHLFAKTCAAENACKTEDELRVLAERYRDTSRERWGCECTVRWETVTADGYRFRDAVDVRVFVKQQHVGFAHR